MNVQFAVPAVVQINVVSECGKICQIFVWDKGTLQLTSSKILRVLTMGATWSSLRRTLRSPGETRAKLEKVLDSEPKVAPKHESTKILLEKMKSENQIAFKADNKKNDKLLDFLKEIRVNSVEQHPATKGANSNLIRAVYQPTRLTNEQFIFLFQQRKTKPEEWTEKKIAEHFKLPSKTVENLLRYYSDFNVETAPQIPEPLAEITH